MATHDVSRDFDMLSNVYDVTRQPLDPVTFQRLVEYLEEHGWSAILEVGVGTGRIALPLVDRGFRVVGVDASRGMLGRAVEKGLPYLVRGNAYRLPFSDGSFDTALFVHVLHILERPELGLREAARVGRHGALAIFDLPPKGQAADRSLEEEPRRIVREALADAGYPDLLRSRPRVKEQEILRSFPPAELRVLSDREVSEPLTRRLDALEKRAYRHVLRVPPDVLARAVAAARAKVGMRTVTYRRTEAVAWWSEVPDAPVTPR
jgi:ubiquinone/menaquinone biosynthesis C-methylase UbiE